MKRFIVRFTNLHKDAKQPHTYVDAERWKCTADHYMFLDGDGNLIAQCERKNVAAVEDITDVLPPK